MPEKLEKRDEALRLEDKEIGRMPLSERREKIAAREDRDEHNEKWDREDGADAIKLWDTVDPFAQGMSPRYAGPQTLHESIFYSEMSGFGENYVPPPDPDADTVPDDTGFAAEQSGWVSIKTPSTPAPTAARASVPMKSGSPPLFPPPAPGRCTE